MRSERLPDDDWRTIYRKEKTEFRFLIALGFVLAILGAVTFAYAMKQAFRDYPEMIVEKVR